MSYVCSDSIGAINHTVPKVAGNIHGAIRLEARCAVCQSMQRGLSWRRYGTRSVPAALSMNTSVDNLDA